MRRNLLNLEDKGLQEPQLQFSGVGSTKISFSAIFKHYRSTSYLSRNNDIWATKKRETRAATNLGVKACIFLKIWLTWCG